MFVISKKVIQKKIYALAVEAGGLKIRRTDQKGKKRQKECSINGEMNQIKKKNFIASMTKSKTWKSWQNYVFE